MRLATLREIYQEQNIRLGAAFRVPDVMLVGGQPVYGTVTHRGPSVGYGFDAAPVRDPRNGIGLVSLCLGV